LLSGITRFGQPMTVAYILSHPTPAEYNLLQGELPAALSGIPDTAIRGMAIETDSFSSRGNNNRTMRVLISEVQIHDRVQELGRQLSREYSGRPLTILGVLTGSVVLLADLIRATNVPLRVALISASSYGGLRTSPGKLTVNSSLVPDLKGRDVVILDDIFDTGHTMAGLYDAVKGFEPNTVKSAVLLWKSDRTEVDLTPDYFGFKIPDEFVVGYGLDFNDEFRHLPYVGIPDSDDLIAAGGQKP
jgi:hypoxanthine phosphoribosyltransferase